MEMTKHDRWGYPVSTSSDECAAAIDAYYDEVLSYGRRRSVILSAVTADPSCALANALAAHFLATKDPTKAVALISAAAAADGATDYEKAVVRTLSCLVGEGMDEDAAVKRHFELLKEYPKDLVSLKRAQVLCFYMGQPDVSLKLVEQVLAQNHDQSYIYGMLAFPLLELGRMDEAERAAKKGFQINSNDIWSQHALCHVLQYECRFQEAVSFMEACSSSWNSCSSFMYTHNWWHVALCYLEAHAPVHKVLDIYINLWKELEKIDADPGDVCLNALGLLMRVYVRGQMGCIEDSTFKDHLIAVAKIFTDESTWHIEWLLDILALWALSCTEEKDKAQKLLESIRSRVYSMSKKRQQIMQRGLVLAEAIYEYGRGNYLKVFDMLGPEFNAVDYKMIGASDEQLDVFTEVWYAVLLNSGNASKAIEEIQKEIEKREGAPFLWRMLEKAYSASGRADASSVAVKASFLEAKYFN